MRNKYMLRADKWEKSYNKENVDKIKIAKQIQILQMLANLFTTEANIAPGVAHLDSNKKIVESETANFLLDWLSFFEHAYKEGKPEDSLRRYEPWKYIYRILDQLVLFEIPPSKKEEYKEVKKLSYDIYKKDRNKYIIEDVPKPLIIFFNRFSPEVNGYISKIRKKELKKSKVQSS